MEYIEKNEYFEVAYDETLNRVFIVIKGFWSVEVGDDYLKSLYKLEAKVTQGFDMFIDATEFVTQKKEVQAQIEQAQKLAMSYQVRKVATLPSKNAIAKFQGDVMTKKNQLPRGIFLTKEDAINWLNEK